VLLGSSMRNVARCVPHRTMPTDGARGGRRAIRTSVGKRARKNAHPRGHIVCRAAAGVLPP
jgi:hypothetical protein